MSPLSTCPVCQSPVPNNARYCPQCGKMLFSSDSHPVLPLSNRWMGERRQVTILFADLGSFTAASEKADPEDVIDMLNTVFTRLMLECEKEGGFLDKTVGDEMMVLFGAPKAHEDDPARAVRAALAMQQAMKDLAGFMRRKVGRICDINIGINTGSVVWGELGPEGHTALTVIGDAVNLAARLEDYATGGQIIVSEAVYHRTGDLFEYEVLEAIEVKGKSGYIPIYAPLGEKETTRKAREEIARTVPFVGRQQEFDLLHAHWSRAGAGYPQTVLLKGEAGLGKTRLATEFVNSLNKYAHAKHPIILRAQNSSGNRETYKPLTQITEQYFGLVENDTDVIRRRKIEDRISALGITSNKFIPLMGYLLGWYSNQLKPDDPEAKRNLAYLHGAAIDAAVDLFFKQAARRPTLIIIDDLQWGDNQIIEWLQRVVTASQMVQVQSGGFQLMVLAITRPRFDLSLNNVQISNIINLSPLTEAERREMLGHILPGEGIPATLITRLTKESDGNPFYLLEVTRELVQSGQLILSSGRWELTRTVDQIEVPHSIEGLVLAKLDTLTPDERRVLQHASVIGMTFNEKLLKEITPVDTIDAALENLLKRGLIRHTGSTAEKGRTFTFAQAVVREVTYNSILRKTRRELHELIADLTVDEARTPTQNLEALAHDYATRGQDEKMIAYNWLAGRHALEKFKFDEAYHHLQMAWDTLIEMPKPNPEIYQNLADALGDAATFTSHFNQAAICYQTAWNLIQNDPEWQATLHYKMGRLHFFQGDPTTALEDYQQALKITAEYPYPQLRAQIEAEIRLLYDLG